MGYPWGILGLSFGNESIPTLNKQTNKQTNPTPKGSMTVHRTLNRAKPFTPQGEGERDEKRGTRGCVPLWDPPNVADTFRLLADYSLCVLLCGLVRYVVADRCAAFSSG